MIRKCGRGRDERDPSLRRFEKSRLARLGEALAHARLHQARFPHILRRQTHRTHAVVASVIVRARHEVEPGPHEILHERRIGCEIKRSSSKLYRLNECVRAEEDVDVADLPYFIHS